MNNHQKTIIAASMSLPGFEDWQPDVDVPELQRPRHRPAELPGEGRQAAVMLLLYYIGRSAGVESARVESAGVESVGSEPEPESDSLAGLHLVLTKRHQNLNKHAGQISLPGGRQDPGETLEQTALRETMEEIGVGSNHIEVLGQLNPVYIPPSDFTVAPFVGWYNGQGSSSGQLKNRQPKSVRPNFTLSETEVEQVIEASVSHLLAPEALSSGPIKIDNGSMREVPYYQVDQHQVWGATAIILSEFLERVSRVVFS